MPATPYSYRQYNSGSTFSVPFPYLLKAHVKAYLDYNLLTGTFTSELVDGVGFTWTSGVQIQTTSALTTGQVLTVIRLTPSDTRLVDWQDGSKLTADDLDTADLQNLYVVQEQQDRNDLYTSQLNANVLLKDGSVAMTGNFSAGSNRIINLAGPTADTDAVNRSYVNTIVANGIGDGDKGDIVVSGSGSVFSIKSKVVSVKDFGAVGDGDADDTAAIQAAFNALTAAQKLVIPEGQYKLSSTISCNSKGVNIDATGAVFLPTTNTSAFNFDNSLDVEYRTLSANYVLGSTTLSVTATTTAIRPGTPFKILSNAVDPYNRDRGSLASQYRISEWSVAAAGSTTTLINLQAALRFGRGIDPVSVAGDESALDSYTTSMNARVAIPVDRTVQWVGGTITYPDGNDATWNAAAFNISGYIRPSIDGLFIKRGYGAGITVNACYGAVITRCSITNLNSNSSLSQFGYGVADCGWLTVVRDCYFARTRHGYTTNAVTITADSTSLRSGRVHGSLVTGCSGVSGDLAVFDTHHDAHDVIFEGCTAQGGNSTGFAVRGINVQLNGCQVIGGLGGLNLFTEYQSGDPDDDLQTAAKPDGWTTCQVNNFTAHVVDLPVSTSYSTVQINNADLKSTGLRLLDNQYSDVSFGGVIKFATTTFFNGYPLLVNAANSAVLTSLHQAGAPTTTTINSGASVQIDCSTISGSTTTPFLFKNTTEGGKVIISGNVSAKLNSQFSGLFTGNLGSAITGNGTLNWEVIGAADNAISTANLNTLKARIFAAAVDNTVCHDWRQNGQQKNVLVFSNTAHAGTGASVTDALVVPYLAVEGLKETNSSVIYRLKLQKTGTVGVATITLNTSALFFDTFTLDADAGLFYIDAQFITTAANTSRGFSETRIWTNEPYLLTTQPKIRTQTGSPFASTDRFLRMTINAAVGDTITLHQYEIISNNLSIGLT